MYKKIIVITIFAFIIVSMFVTSYSYAKTINVAVYNNKPLMFKDKEGNLQGFFIDLLNFIAEKEDWDIHYTYENLEKVLEDVRNNRVDIAPGIAFSNSRKEMYNYSNETLFINWGQLYTSKEVIKSFLDLKNKKIGVLKEDIHYTGEKGIKNILNQFHINVQFIEFDKKNNIFKSLERNRIDAGVVNRTYGYTNEDNYDIYKTQLIFNPIEMKVISARDNNNELLSTIDYYINDMKNNNPSFYEQKLDYWFNHSHNQNTENQFLNYIEDIMGLLVGIIVVLSLIIFFFWRQKKTIEKMALELEKTNEKLIESQKMFKLNFEESNIGMVIEDLSANFINVNKAFIEMLGYSKEELLHKNMSDITYQEDLKKSMDSLKRMLEGKSKTVNFEKRYIHKNGDIVWVNLNSSIAFDEGGNPVYLLAHIEDITERKEAEKKILQQQKEIEHQKLRTRFFANLSHEFKTPLNLIFSALQMLNLHLKNESYNNIKFKKYLSIIKQNSYRILKLTNNLVDITKIESDSFSIKLQNVDIVRLIKKIVYSIKDYIEDKGRVIKFESGVDKKIIACDPFEIERIILNLLSNAVKFTDKDDRIFVSIATGRDYVSISVKDTGIGIKEENEATIFKEFGQVDKSFSRNHEGSGLGLSIVKSLFELHGGTISLNSKLGEGSKFTIKIPDQKVAAEEINMDYNYENDIDNIDIEFSDVYNF